MPENNSPNRRGPNKGSPERFQPKVILIWVAIIAVMLTIWFQSNKTGTADVISMAQVIELTKEDKIIRGKISPMPNGGADWYEIVGTRSVDAAAPETWSAVAGR